MIHFIFKFVCFFFSITVNSFLFANPTESGEKPKVLVLEDHNMTRNLLVDFLIEENYNVRSAGNTEKGLELWLSFKPDIVITDMSMPLSERGLVEKTAGLELIKNAPRDKVKIILASSHSPSSSMIMEAGPMIDALLQKPYKIDDLLFKLRHLLENQETPARILTLRPPAEGFPNPNESLPRESRLSQNPSGESYSKSTALKNCGLLFPRRN